MWYTPDQNLQKNSQIPDNTDFHLPTLVVKSDFSFHFADSPILWGRTFSPWMMLEILTVRYDHDQMVQQEKLIDLYFLHDQKG